MIFEFAISAGEGTLIDYGRCGGIELADMIGAIPDRGCDIRVEPIYAGNDTWCAVMFDVAPLDCTTGE